MSKARLSKQIRLGGDRVLRLEPRRLLLAVPAAALSTLSVSVFCYMRRFAQIGQYYDGARQGLLRDSLSLQSLIPALLLLLFYAAALHLADRVRFGSAALSLALGFATVAALSMEHSGLTEIFLPAGPAGNAAVLLGFALLLYACIELLYRLCDRRTRYRIWADELDRGDGAALFLGASGCILLLWLPILFLCYPGSVMNDTRNQIMSWLGLKRMTAANPILTTALYGLLYQAGLRMGGQEKAIFLNVLFQAVFNAAAMGLAATRICRYTRSRSWLWAALLFFGVLPVWQSAAQVVMKDVLHTGCFLLFTAVYLDCLRRREKSWRSVLLLFLTALLVAYTRKATFYLAVICILAAALYHWRVFLLPYLAMLGVFVGLFWFSNNVLYPRLNIEPEWESENYSLQFQQVALYCRSYGDELTPEEIAVIDGTLDYETIVREYTPMISDPVKGTFHGSEADHAAFWQLYRQMLRRHPLLFVKATVMGSFEHLNPWFEDVNFRLYIARDESFFTVDYSSGLQGRLYQLWTACLKIPVLRLLIGTGLYAWLQLCLLGYALRKKSGLALLGQLPSLTLLVGLFMSHVNGEIRYGYPLIAAAPLCFAWTLYAVSVRSPENPNRGAARLPREGGLGLLRRRRAEKPDGPAEADAPLTEPPAAGNAGPTVCPGEMGPVLNFVMRYIPVPAKPRTELDVLRVLAIFLVLWSCSEGFGLYASVPDMPRHLLYLCASIFDTIAVPLFYMVSGALLLGREESWGRLLRHRVRRFARILLIVSVLSYVCYYRGSADFSLGDFLSRLYTGRVLPPLRYLYGYLAMLLTLPFLRKLARGMREVDYLWLLGLYTLSALLSAADSFWFKGALCHSPDFYLFTSWSYVLFALFGYYIARVMPRSRLNLENLALLLMLGVLAVGATDLLTERRMRLIGEWTADNSQTFFNTLIAFPSIAVFFAARLWFARHPVSGRAAAIWSLLATGTFGAYLFERFWRDTARFVYDGAAGRLGLFTASLLQILTACALGILATLLYKLLAGLLREALRRRSSARREKKQEERALHYTVPDEDISDLEEIETLLVSKHRGPPQP